jgi:DNA-binding transcriptional regulator YiaG
MKETETELDQARQVVIELARQRGKLPPPEVCWAIRRRAGVSRPKLAAAVGVSDAAIALWEKGTRRPRAEFVERYADVLNEIARAMGMTLDK